MLSASHVSARSAHDQSAELAADTCVADIPSVYRVSRLSARTFLVWFSVAFVVAFGLVWTYVAAMPMAFLSRDYPLWIAKRTMLDECRLGSVAVFGDSRTVAAVMPEVMPLPVMNFAMSGTSPIETYFAVRRALRCQKLPELVVIAHGALKFSSDSDYWVFGARTGFLSYDDMRAVDADAASMTDNEIDDLWRDNHLPLALREKLYSLHFPAFYFDSLVNAFGAARWQHNSNALHDNLLSSGHALFGRAAGSSGITAEGTSPRFTTSPLVDLYFSRTLAMLTARGVPVVLLSMPINHANYARMLPSIRTQFGVYLRDKARQFPAMRTVGPAIPCWPDEFFGDAWHFNARGADEYSRALGTWLSAALSGTVPDHLPDRCTQKE